MGSFLSIIDSNNAVTITSGTTVGAPVIFSTTSETTFYVTTSSVFSLSSGSAITSSTLLSDLTPSGAPTVIRPSSVTIVDSSSFAPMTTSLILQTPSSSNSAVSSINSNIEASSRTIGIAVLSVAQSFPTAAVTGSSFVEETAVSSSEGIPISSAEAIGKFSVISTAGPSSEIYSRSYKTSVSKFYSFSVRSFYTISSNSVISSSEAILSYTYANVTSQYKGSSIFSFIPTFVFQSPNITSEPSNNVIRNSLSTTIEESSSIAYVTTGFSGSPVTTKTVVCDKSSLNPGVSTKTNVTKTIGSVVVCVECTKYRIISKGLYTVTGTVKHNNETVTEYYTYATTVPYDSDATTETAISTATQIYDTESIIANSTAIVSITSVGISVISNAATGNVEIASDKTRVSSSRNNNPIRSTTVSTVKVSEFPSNRNINTDSSLSSSYSDAHSIVLPIAPNDAATYNFLFRAGFGSSFLTIVLISLLLW